MVDFALTFDLSWLLYVEVPRPQTFLDSSLDVRVY